MMTILQGDVIEQLATLPDNSVHCVVTSPPYWALRSYLPKDHALKAKEIGSEPTPEAFIATMVAVFAEVRRVLHPSGTCWVNIGDSYAHDNPSGPQGKNGDRASRTFTAGGAGGKQHGLKPKDLCLIPERLALALQADGWWVRSRIAWCKRSPMPESVTDRPTSAWEHIWLLSKSARYFYDAEAVSQPAQSDHPSGNGFAGRQGGAEYHYKTGGVGTADQWNSVGGKANLRNFWLLGPEPFSGWTETVRWHRVAADAACDGMRRITSASCPVHGCADHQGGERAGGLETHNHSTSSRLESELQAGHVSSSMCPEPLNLASTSDCADPSHAQTATPHSSQTRRTDHAPDSSLACTPCAQTENHTERTLEPHDSSGSAERTPESSTSPGVLDDSLWERIPFHTVCKSSLPVSQSCCCEYYQKKTEKTSHFATYPSEIPKRAILAGTSARGCCPKCLAPWERVVEKTKTFESGSGRSGNSINGKQNLRASETNSTPDIRMGPCVSTRTTGWEPKCSCNSETGPHTECDDGWHDSPIPCTVLDPFGGSGTTGQVALELGRKAILVELNPKYVELIRRRCDVTPGLQLA